MQASDALREKLANRYNDHDDWKRAIKRAGLDPIHVVLEGSSFVVWTNIFEAVRVWDNLDGMREMIADHQPDLLPLFEQYAADLARGGGKLTDLPELAFVLLSEADLEAEVVLRSLAFKDTFRVGLIELALSAKAPKAEEIDDALQGIRTSEAKTLLAHYLNKQVSVVTVIETRIRKVKEDAERLKKEIADIESAQLLPRPMEPELFEITKGQENTYESRHANDMNRMRHHNNMQIYNAALESYRTGQLALPTLRSDAQSADRELGHLYMEIAKHKAQVNDDVNSFHLAIKDAREQDLVRELGHMLAGANEAFRTKEDSFKGFWTLLAAACALDFVKNTVTNAAFATEARQRFMVEASSLSSFVQGQVVTIARGCLAGPTVVARVLDSNQAICASLGERLGKLPSEHLVENTRLAREVIAVPPKIPPYAHLEHPDDVNAMEQQLTDLAALVSARVVGLQEELSKDLRNEVWRALADAAATIHTMRAVAGSQSAVLMRSRILWDLIDRGAASGELPDFARALCGALPHEFASRSEMKPTDLFIKASDTIFGLRDAQALVEAPILANYVKSGDELRHNLAASEQRLADIDEALLGLTVQIQIVADRFQAKLNCIAGLAVVPFVGLILAIWAILLVERLGPLVKSGDAHYIKVGCAARSKLLVGSALSGVTAVVSVTVAMAALGDLDGRWLLLTSACCVIAFALFLYSLVAIWRLKIDAV